MLWCIPIPIVVCVQVRERDSCRVDTEIRCGTRSVANEVLVDCSSNRHRNSHSRKLDDENCLIQVVRTNRAIGRHGPRDSRNKPHGKRGGLADREIRIAETRDNRERQRDVQRTEVQATRALIAHSQSQQSRLPHIHGADIHRGARKNFVSGGNNGNLGFVHSTYSGKRIDPTVAQLNILTRHNVLRVGGQKIRSISHQSADLGRRKTHANHFGSGKHQSCNSGSKWSGRRSAPKPSGAGTRVVAGGIAIRTGSVGCLNRQVSDPGIVTRRDNVYGRSPVAIVRSLGSVVRCADGDNAGNVCRLCCWLTHAR